MTLAFSTKRKGSSAWRSDAGSGSVKQAKKAWEKDLDEKDDEDPKKLKRGARNTNRKEDDSAFGRLKRDLAERERIKAERKRDLEKEALILGRTRGEVAENDTPAILTFLDVEVGGSAGRMIFEIFADVVPRTAKNFVQLVEEKKYVNTAFFRVQPGVSCVGGDLESNDGSGGKSIYGRDFEDENHTLKHTNAGVLTTHPRRLNANNSQFQILFDERPGLDGRCVVFGRLVEGFALLRAIEKLGTKTGVPTALAKVTGCGKIEPEATLQAALDKHRVPYVPPKPKDPKAVARNYRNKTKYYDTSTRSALFSWTTSC